MIVSLESSCIPGISLFIVATLASFLANTFVRRKTPTLIELFDSNTILHSPPSAYSSLIGNTPLIKLHRLSSMIKRDIYVKIESLNPGGTGKDRAVKRMLEQARTHPNYQPGCVIVEGSSGSTGISLAAQVSLFLYI